MRALAGLPVEALRLALLSLAVPALMLPALELPAGKERGERVILKRYQDSLGRKPCDGCSHWGFLAVCCSLRGAKPRRSVRIVLSERKGAAAPSETDAIRAWPVARAFVLTRAPGARQALAGPAAPVEPAAQARSEVRVVSEGLAWVARMAWVEQPPQLP